MAGVSPLLLSSPYFVKEQQVLQEGPEHSTLRPSGILFFFDNDYHLFYRFRLYSSTLFHCYNDFV
jgi:hypothetical protein